MSKVVYEIDTEDYYQAPTDEQGHSSKEWFRCTNQLVKQVKMIKENPNFPQFTSKEQIYRAGTAMLLKHLLRLDKTAPSIMGQVEIMNAYSKEMQYAEDFQNFIETVDKLVYKLTSMGGAKEIARHILFYRTQIEQMPEGFWRDKYMSTLKDKFGNHLDALGYADLLNPEPEEENGD